MSDLYGYILLALILVACAYVAIDANLFYPQGVPMPTTLPKNPRYEIYQDTGGEYRWRFRAKNGLIMADSAEGYAKKGNAIRAAEEFRKLNRGSLPVPIVHWEAGEKDVGGRPLKAKA